MLNFALLVCLSTVMGILAEPYCTAVEGEGGEEVQFKYENVSPDRTVYSSSLIITTLYGRALIVKNNNNYNYSIKRFLISVSCVALK